MRNSLAFLVGLAGYFVVASASSGATDAGSSTVWADPFVTTDLDVTLISHAGGGLPQGAYSNSLESLDRAADAGLIYFEVDLNWTSDEQLVLIHDWRDDYRAWFERSLFRKVDQKIRKPERPVTHRTFMNLEFRHGLTQLDLGGLMTWVKNNPKARIVTDVKEDNLAGLRIIAAQYPDLMQNIVPQIYQLSEYASVSELGFTDIVFTSYRSDASLEEIVTFSEMNTLHAVTMPVARLSESNLRFLESLDVPLWTHTINDPVKAGWLALHGVDGLYTDYLTPGSNPALYVAEMR